MRQHLVWMSLLLPMAAVAGNADVDLSPPAPAMFTGPAVFGDGEYTGPRTGPSTDRTARATGRLRGGCPTAPDGSERGVTGSVTTGFGHSSRGGSSQWNAADVNLCKERLNANGDVSTLNMRLRVANYDGPGYGGYGGPGYGYGGMYRGGMGYGFDGFGPGYGDPFDPWSGMGPVRRESWSDGRQPWR